MEGACVCAHTHDKYVEGPVNVVRQEAISLEVHPVLAPVLDGVVTRKKISVERKPLLRG